MSTDIRDAIERSFGEGPEPPAPELLLTRGRRALRRRRLVEAGSGVAAAAVVVTATVLGAHGTTEGAAPRRVDPASATATRAGEPTPSPSPAAAGTFPRAGTPPLPDPRVSAEEAVSPQADGVHVSTAVRVVRLVDDPWGVRPRAWSVALVYRVHGTTYWYAGYLGARYGGQAASIPAAHAGLPFDAWVRQQEEIYRPGHGGRGDHASARHRPAQGGGGGR